jgi:hypothetical protein
VTVPRSEPSTPKTLGEQDFGARQLFRRPQNPITPSFQSAIAYANGNNGGTGGGATLTSGVLTSIKFDTTAISTGATAFQDQTNGVTSTAKPVKTLLEGWYLYWLDFSWVKPTGGDVRLYQLFFDASGYANNDNAYAPRWEAGVTFVSEGTFPYGPLYIQAPSSFTLKVQQNSGGNVAVSGVIFTSVFLGPDFQGSFPVSL